MVDVARERAVTGLKGCGWEPSIKLSPPLWPRTTGASGASLVMKALSGSTSSLADSVPNFGTIEPRLSSDGGRSTREQGS